MFWCEFKYYIKSYGNKLEVLFMYNEFVKETPIFDKSDEQKDEELVDTIKIVNQTLKNMHNIK